MFLCRLGRALTLKEVIHLIVARHNQLGTQNILDLSIILSITSCEETWDLFNAAESEHLLHVAISGL